MITRGRDGLRDLWKLHTKLLQVSQGATTCLLEAFRSTCRKHDTTFWPRPPCKQIQRGRQSVSTSAYEGKSSALHCTWEPSMPMLKEFLHSLGYAPRNMKSIRYFGRSDVRLVTDSASMCPVFDMPVVPFLSFGHCSSPFTQKQHQGVCTARSFSLFPTRLVVASSQAPQRGSAPKGRLAVRSTDTGRVEQGPETLGCGQTPFTGESIVSSVVPYCGDLV